MIMYHGTSLTTWQKIQQEEVLWGIRNAPSRCTYLANSKDEAACYGNVVLEVDFNPDVDTPNNYMKGAWQCRVYVPIPLSRVRMLKK